MTIYEVGYVDFEGNWKSYELYISREKAEAVAEKIGYMVIERKVIK